MGGLLTKPEPKKEQVEKKEEEPREIIYNKWKLHKEKILGGGSYAKVYEGESIGMEPKRKVAIKFIPRQKIDLVGKPIKEAIIREIYVLYILSKKTKFNPTLLRFLDHSEAEEGIYIVLEYCDSGTLNDVLKKTKSHKIYESEALRIAFQIAIGLLDLSQSKIIHRDLKPANIFKHEGLYKIGDFGFSNRVSKFDSVLGTKPYMAPEFHVKGDSDLTDSVDIWAFGCLVHKMIFGKVPFKDSSEIQLRVKVIFDPYEIPNSPKISKGTKNMLRRCMEKNPSKRITISQLIRHKCFDECRETIQEKLNFKVKLPPIIIPEPKELEIYQFVRDVTRELEAYRMVYKFFFRTSERLLKVGNEDYCSLSLLNSAIGRAKYLDKIMEQSKKKALNNKEIPIQSNLNNENNFWMYFQRTKKFKKMKKKVENMIDEYKKEFHERFMTYKKDRNIGENDKESKKKINFDEKKILEKIEDLKKKKKKFKDNYGVRLKLAMRLLLITKIKQNRYYEPYYYKITSFCEKISKKDNQQILNFLDEFSVLS